MTLTFGVKLKKSVRHADLNVPGGNRYSSGDVVRSGEWSPGTIKKIDPGPENGRIFYLYTTHDVFVVVTTPSTAFFQLMHDRTKRIASFSHPSQEIVLFPAHGGIANYER